MIPKLPIIPQWPIGIGSGGNNSSDANARSTGARKIVGPEELLSHCSRTAARRELPHILIGGIVGRF